MNIEPMTPDQLAAVRAWPTPTVPGSSGHLVARLVATIDAGSEDFGEQWSSRGDPGIPREVVLAAAPLGRRDDVSEPLTAEEEVLFRGVTDRYGMIRPSDMLRVWATLDAARATPALDVAWAEAEAALPEGWRVSSLSWPSNDDDEWVALAGGEGQVTGATGPTPAAALQALAARLRKPEAEG